MLVVVTSIWLLVASPELEPLPASPAARMNLPNAAYQMCSPDWGHPTRLWAPKSQNRAVFIPRKIPRPSPPSPPPLPGPTNGRRARVRYAIVSAHFMEPCWPGTPSARSTRGGASGPRAFLQGFSGAGSLRCSNVAQAQYQSSGCALRDGSLSVSDGGVPGGVYKGSDEWVRLAVCPGFPSTFPLGSWETASVSSSAYLPCCSPSYH